VLYINTLNRKVFGTFGNQKGRRLLTLEVENSGVVAIDIHACDDILTTHTIEYAIGMTK
jgi:hypothetical protein